jgi:hypothetical protein
MISDISQFERQISKAKAELIERRSHPDEDDGTLAVLFTGNWHAAFPRQLVLDQTLSPVEKITWQAIRLAITDSSRPGATPRRDELAAMINCSGPTVTSSRTMLRLCRWMTFCESVREKGRFVGDIYLLNDEPISLASTLKVDSSYVAFLQQQVQAGSKRLRTVAATLLREIDAVQDIEQPTELEQISNRFTTLMNAQKPVHHHHSKIFAMVDQHKNSMQNNAIDTSSPAFEAQSKIFAMDDAVDNDTHAHRSKNLSMVENDQSKFFTRAKNFFPLARGSNNNSINNKYIPARETEMESLKNNQSTAVEPLTRFENFNHEMDTEKTFALAVNVFPELNSRAIKRYVSVAFGIGKENQMPIIKRLIDKVPEPTRTYVLLQLIGRYAADTHGWNIRWLDKPIAFTKKLVERALADQFFPDEWALALETAIASGDDPYFPDTPELMRLKRAKYESDDVGVLS